MSKKVPEDIYLPSPLKSPIVDVVETSKKFGATPKSERIEA